jgi:hypothetical protein
VTGFLFNLGRRFWSRVEAPLAAIFLKSHAVYCSESAARRLWSRVLSAEQREWLIADG